MKFRSQLCLREPQELSRESHLFGIGNGCLIEKSMRNRHRDTIHYVYTMRNIAFSIFQFQYQPSESYSLANGSVSKAYWLAFEGVATSQAETTESG